MESIIKKDSPEKDLFKATSNDYLEENIDDILESIKLDYARNCFIHYMLEVKTKLKKQGKIVYINDLTKTCSPKIKKII